MSTDSPDIANDEAPSAVPSAGSSADVTAIAEDSTGASATRVERPAQWIDGRYRVIRQLGRGGMGTVYLVRDRFGGGREVALKQVRQDRLDPKTLTILVNEFLSLASLTHPNLARVHDFGVDAITEDIYFTIEVVDGVDWLKASRALDLGDETHLRVFLDLTAQVLRGLGFIHSRGLVHADIKPENILVAGVDTSADPTSWRPCAKLIDFGLAKREKAFGGKKIIGTTYYIPPEIIRGARVDRRSDLYSLGVLLYHLATDALPFKGKSAFAVFKGHLEELPRPPRELRSSIPDALSEIILRLLEKRPDDRYANAFEVLEAINRGFGLSLPLETEESSTGYLDVLRRVSRESELLRVEGIASRATQTQSLSPDNGNDLSELTIESDRDPAQGVGSTHVPSGRLVVLRGEKGLGKRSLVRSLVHRLETQGVGLIEVDCGESRERRDRGLRTLVHRLLARAPEGLTRRAACEELSRVLKGVSEEDPGAAVEAGMDDLLQLALEIASAKPLLLVVQDAHLATAALADFLGRLVAEISRRSKGGSRLMIVATALDYSDTEATAFQRLYESSVFRRSVLDIKVNRLEREALRRSCLDVFSPGVFPEEFLDRLFEESDGNVDVLVDVIQHLLRARMMGRTGGSWGLTDAYDGRAVSGKMRVDLEQRIRSLPDEAFRLAVAFSCLGRSGEVEIAWKLAGVEPDSVEANLRLLQREKLLEECLEGAARSSFTFVHSSAREVLYEMIPGERRAGVHDRAGALYEELLGAKANERAADLAFHFLRGNDREKGVRYGVLAAEQHVKMFRPQRAAVLYRRVLAKIAPTDRARRDAVKEALAQICFELGDYERVLAVLSREDAGDGVSPVGVSNLRVAQALGYLGDFDAATEEIRKLVRSSLRQPGGDLLARILAASAELHAAKGSVVESVRCADRVIRLPAAQVKPETLGAAFLTLAESHYRLDNPDAAARFSQEALRIYDAKGGTFTPDLHLFCLGRFYKYRGKLEKAIQQFEVCGQLNRRAGVVARQAMCLLEIGNLHRALERPRDAVRPLEEACALYRKTGNQPFLLDASSALADTHFVLGQAEEAHRCLDVAFEIAGRAGNRDAEARCLLTLAFLRLDEGDRGRVSECLERAASRESLQSSGATLRAMEIRFAQSFHDGRYGDALEFAKKGLALCREGESRRFSSWLLSQRAALLCRLGDRVEARRGVVRLLEIAQSQGFELAEGRARWVEGVIAVSEGRHADAERAFLRANDVFTAARSERELAQLHLDHGLALLRSGDDENAYLHFEEGTYLAKKLNLERLKASFHFAMGVRELVSEGGVLQRAEGRFRLAEQIAERVPYPELLWQSRYYLSRIARLDEREEAAEELQRGAIHARKLVVDSIPVSLRSSYLKAMDDQRTDERLEEKSRAELAV